jgi:hypothetical protein
LYVLLSASAATALLSASRNWLFSTEIHGLLWQEAFWYLLLGRVAGRFGAWITIVIVTIVVFLAFDFVIVGFRASLNEVVVIAVCADYYFVHSPWIACRIVSWCAVASFYDYV